MIQIRNVPDRLHRRLKTRAANEGMSLSGYLLSEIREIAERPTLAEFREILHRASPSQPTSTQRELFANTEMLVNVGSFTASAGTA